MENEKIKNKSLLSLFLLNLKKIFNLIKTFIVENFITISLTIITSFLGISIISFYILNKNKQTIEIKEKFEDVYKEKQNITEIKGKKKPVLKLQEFHLEDGSTIVGRIIKTENEQIIIFPEEIYQDEDVIEEEIREFESFESEEPTVFVYVKLKAEYVIEEIDLSIEYAKEEKMKEINLEYENALKPIMEKYPQFEREGWAVKESQARKWLNASEIERVSLKGELIMLVSESEDNTDEAITDFANRVLGDSNAYQFLYGNATKLRRKHLKDLIEAINLEEIKLV